MRGWWMCTVPAWNDPRMPDPAGYGPPVDAAGGVRIRWLTASTILLLNELAESGHSAGIQHIWGSWTAPRSRLFQGWATKVEKAFQRAEAFMSARDGDGTPSVLAMDAERVRDTIKATYREMPGMWDSAASWVTRPDWYAEKKALERANAWRTAWKLGQSRDVWPVRVDGDKWTYRSDVEDGEQAEPVSRWKDDPGMTLGDKLGNWRLQSTEVMP
jgi:hypothetical protein